MSDVSSVGSGGSVHHTGIVEPEVTQSDKAIKGMAQRALTFFRMDKAATPSSLSGRVEEEQTGISPTNLAPEIKDPFSRVEELKHCFRGLYEDYDAGKTEQESSFHNLTGSEINIAEFLKYLYNPRPDDSREPLRLVNELYVFADFIETKEMFLDLKSRVGDKVQDSPPAIEFLRKLRFEDEPCHRLLVSIFFNPAFKDNLDVFDRDFHRTSFLMLTEGDLNKHIGRDEFIKIVTKTVPEHQRSAFLHFFSQVSESYSFIMALALLGQDVVGDRSFYFVQDGSNIHFGYYQVHQNPETEQSLIHFLEYTFLPEGDSLINRIKKEETLDYFVSPADVNKPFDKAPPHLQNLLSYEFKAAQEKACNALAVKGGPDAQARMSYYFEKLKNLVGDKRRGVEFLNQKIQAFNLLRLDERKALLKFLVFFTHDIENKSGLFAIARELAPIDMALNNPKEAYQMAYNKVGQLWKMGHSKEQIYQAEIYINFLKNLAGIP